MFNTFNIVLTSSGQVLIAYWLPTLRKKATVHQVTTMLAISENVLFSGPNHLLTTGANDPIHLIIACATAMVIIKVKGHQHRWLSGG